MDADVKRQIGELDGMTVAELREKWREVFGEGSQSFCSGHVGERRNSRRTCNVKRRLSG